jgi:hypothetical protein
VKGYGHSFVRSLGVGLPLMHQRLITALSTVVEGSFVAVSRSGELALFCCC